MPKSILKFLGLFACAALAACSTMEVKTAQDPTANLLKYKTYAWAAEARAEKDKPASSILDETVKADVERQMAYKGYQKVPPSKADLLLSYTATSRNQVTYGVAPGYWGWWGPANEAYVTRVGELMLQFIDPKSRRTIWQGSAQDAIESAGASQSQVAEAVKGIMEKFPAA